MQLHRKLPRDADGPSGPPAGNPRSQAPWVGTRLLDVRQAAAYLSVSYWTLRKLINDGSVPTVRLPRPQTDRMRKRRPVSDTLRRVLVDRHDLDRLVERWKERL